MNTASKVLAGIGVFVVLAAAIFLGVKSTASPSVDAPPSGATVASVNWYQGGIGWFGNAFYVGTAQQFAIDSSGNVSTTGTFAATGAATLSSTLSVTGKLTIAGGTLRSNVNSTSTTATSQTLVVADVNTYDTIILTPTVGSDALTLFASSTATAFLPTAGNSQTTCIINGTTTAGIVLTVAGGTGTILQVASSSLTVLGSTTIGPQKQGCFTFTRANSTATTFDILSAFTVFK